MMIKGKLVGFKSVKSQKGNDCFFGYVVSADPNDSSLVGSKTTQISAFGSDAVSLRQKCFDKKLLDKEVSVNGYFNNNNFFAVTID